MRVSLTPVKDWKYSMMKSKFGRFSRTILAYRVQNHRKRDQEKHREGEKEKHRKTRSRTRRDPRPGKGDQGADQGRGVEDQGGRSGSGAAR